MSHGAWKTVSLLLLVNLAGRFADAADPPSVLRVSSPNRPLNDTRLGPLKSEQGDFLLDPAGSIDEAKARAAYVRRVMQVTMGLWPMPQKHPLNSVVHGKLDLGDYTIEKVYFESLPGFYVTGNLYRPKGVTGRRAAVLSPHGHFPGGRFQDEGLDEVRRKIEQGAERYDEGGRSFMQSRCVQLARMGCVVFHYDMVGYGDCQQIPLDVAHRFSQSRRQFDQPPDEGFYSASALLHLNNQLGLHTWNAIRALDFLTGLPDVDPRRIAVTGGSGGGTQSFMLCAVDDRPLVSVPVVIVSADRQGGCTCENICGLRIDTHNLDFTALHAPKPLLLISADDATRTMAARGFPELKQHYRAYGAAENVEHAAFTQFPHNYNIVSRNAMYEFLNEHLELGLDSPIVERPYRRLSKEELTVWNDEHPAPPVFPRYDQILLRRINTATRKRLAELTPQDMKSLAKYRELVGGGWDVLLRGLPNDHQTHFEPRSAAEFSDGSASLGLLRYRTVERHTAEMPMIVLNPKDPQGRTVIWVSESGKAILFETDGSLRRSVRKLLSAGRTVIGVDLFQQGEFLDEARPVSRQPALPGEAAFGGWTYCYNEPLFARRVHDILAAVEQVRRDRPESKIDVIGLQEAGPLVAAALAQLPETHQVDHAAIDTGGFRFAGVKDVYDVRFLPGAAKYGDVPALLTLARPAELWLAGEATATIEKIRAVWRAEGNRRRLATYSGRDPEPNAINWLLE